MDIKSFVCQAGRVFNRDGDPCDFGCHESAVPKMIEHVKEHLPSYRYCVIADWVWIDINVTPEELKHFDERGGKALCNLCTQSNRRRGWETLRIPTDDIPAEFSTELHFPVAKHCLYSPCLWHPSLDRSHCFCHRFFLAICRTLDNDQPSK